MKWYWLVVLVMGCFSLGFVIGRNVGFKEAWEEEMRSHLRKRS